MTLIADSAAGYFIQAGKVDIIFVGADRVVANGDVANKIGTYKLAVVAKENGVAFYAVVPTSTIDLAVSSGKDIPIEERGPEEVTQVRGQLIAPEGVQVANPAFDITPHRYITGIITEHGIAIRLLTEACGRLCKGASSNVFPWERGVRDTFEPEFLPMNIGSLPHTDPEEACNLILRHFPEVSAWPQLPRRSFLENMYVQFSEGFPGVVLERERMYVDRTRDLSGELGRLYLAYLENDLECMLLALLMLQDWPSGQEQTLIPAGL